MKKIFIALAFSFGACFISTSSQAQDQEIQQLILNIEKLSQFKKILQQLYDGYKILETGYNKVKDITSGNFNLHELFLDGLWLVSPEIKKYRRVADIIQDQVELVTNYKKALGVFKATAIFSDDELAYLGKVYSGLLDKSGDNLDALLMVITDSKLRMSDDERLQRIDRIYADMEDMLAFLHSFNSSTQVLAAQRLKEAGEIRSLQQLFDVK